MKSVRWLVARLPNPLVDTLLINYRSSYIEKVTANDSLLITINASLF